MADIILELPKPIEAIQSPPFQQGTDSIAIHKEEEEEDSN